MIAMDLFEAPLFKAPRPVIHPLNIQEILNERPTRSISASDQWDIDQLAEAIGDKLWAEHFVLVEKIKQVEHFYRFRPRNDWNQPLIEQLNEKKARLIDRAISDAEYASISATTRQEKQTWTTVWSAGLWSLGYIPNDLLDAGNKGDIVRFMFEKKQAK